MADTATRWLNDLAHLEASDRPEDHLTGELAWCLARFVEATADEDTMRRAQLALREWRAMARIPPTSPQT